MHVSRSSFVAIVLLCTAALPAWAGWNEFWAEFDLHRRRVQAWPEPFSAPDREVIRSPFRDMVDNGWRIQTTLPDELFLPDTNELNLAGKRQVRQIVTELPPHRRQITVVEGQSPEATAARTAATAKYAADLAPDQPPVSVQTTRITPRRLDGRYFDKLQSSAVQSRTTPAATGTAAAPGATPPATGTSAAPNAASTNAGQSPAAAAGVRN